MNIKTTNFVIKYGLSMGLALFLLVPYMACAAESPQYKSALLMDYETGQVLFAENAHKSVIPASVVKMMVLLITMEQIEAGKIHLSDIVTVSAWASKIGGHQVYLAEHETFRLEELLKAIAIGSANDAATAVAEFVAGSANAFVELMNIRAEELGMLNTIFSNEHGLPPDPGQEENVTTAYDVALLGQALIKHPQILTWTSTEEDTFRAGTFTLTNTNRQLLRNYRGLDGLKTGFHPRGASFCICATARRDERRMIAVVMGAPQKSGRYKAVTNLLNMGFTQFERVIALQKGFTVGGPIAVHQGKKRTVHLVASENAVVLIKKSQRDHIRQEVQIAAERIQAPALQGTRFGTVTVFVDDEPTIIVDLVLDEDLKKGSLVDRLKWWLVNKVS